MELQMDNRLNKAMLIIGIILAVALCIWYAGIIKNNTVLEKAEITQIVETASDCVIAKLVTIATKTENEQIKRKHLEQARYECENSHLELLTASDCVIAKLVPIATKTENEQIPRKHLEQARYECENSHLEVLKSRASANPKAVRDKL